MSTFARVVDLPLEISSYELEPHELEVSSEFTRLSTVIRLKGGGEEGIGEDVTYDALRRPAHDRAAPPAPRALPDPPFQARPDEQVDGRADRRAGRDRRRRLGRLQGLLQGHSRRPAGRPGPVQARGRGVPGRLDR